MSVLDVISGITVLAGVAFIGVSVIGLFRLPDLYSRAHGVAKSETFGLLLVFVGLMIRPDLDVPTAARLALVLIFSLLANPTAVHALVRAAFRTGAHPQVLTDQRAADAEARTDGEGGARR